MTDTKEQSLVILKQKRSSIKGQITKFENYLSSANFENATMLQTRELQLKLNKFEELSTKFDDIQSQIEVLVESSDLQNEIDERDRYENKFCTLIASAGLILNPLEENDVISSHSSYKSKGSITNDGAALGDQIKLPTIKLPTFDGDHLKWLEFRDMFESLIHNNDRIPPMNKFHYLRSSLEGGAAVAIQSIDFTANNYKLAWELLCERFNNKRILINNHLKSLYNLEAFTKESHTSLRLMIDHVSKNLRALSSLGEPTDHWDTLIIFNMSSKLDSATGRKWEEHKSSLSGSVTLKEFYQFLRDRADVLETLQFSKVDTGRTERNIFNKNTSVRQTKSLHAATTSDNKIECVLCKHDHRLEYCHDFIAMTPESRLSTVRQFKLCANCFRPGHHHSRCRRAPCTICKKKHNSLVHLQKISSNSNEANGNNNCDNSPNSINQVNSPRNSEPISEQSNLPNSSVHVAAALCGEVLLCTAVVEMVGPNNTYHARALLDSGSQSSFVTEKLKTMLNLQVSNTKRVTICGVNNNNFDIVERCEIKIKSRLDSFSKTVSCLVIPKITGSLPNVEVDYTQLSLPENIELADPAFFRPSDIDLLLGADVFWDLVETKHIKLGNNRPTLTLSKLGWLISGPVGECTQKTDKRVKCNFSQEIKDRLSMFWELEEIHTTNKLLSSDEQFCEDDYNENVKRLPDGRFPVKMPLRSSPEESLGDTNSVAKRCFFNLERKLQSKPHLEQMPAFLLQGDDAWPNIKSVVADLPEMKTNLNIKVKDSPTVVDFSKYSKLIKLQKIFAYVMRFINACKQNKIKGSLTVHELNTSLQLLTKLSQAVSFSNEIKALSTNKKLNVKSSILSLNPFLDDNGILRVGRRFWPTKGLVLARSPVHSFHLCKRLKGKTMQPIIGNLPKPRVGPSPPFETCGADFASPYSILNRKGRGAKVSKCYLCIFICFFTKAIHLEVVSDLSTNSFILSLRRLISRRGKRKTIFCYNGTNFVGTNNELQRMLKSDREPVNEFACSNGIEFKFSPAYSPNFGGIWEVGVKAAKFHLKRIVGSSILTFKELTTLFTQIEAILNSLLPLTPGGHFLIGRPLASLPSPSTEKTTLNRYHQLEALRQHFWKKWSKEFVSDLQQRVKWRTTGHKVKLGDLVILKDEHLPPMKWSLSRVETLHPGSDGITRVVDVRTGKGVVRRAVSELCPLPAYEEEDDQGKILEAGSSKAPEDVNAKH